jgi:hypothetical protein
LADVAARTIRAIASIARLRGGDGCGSRNVSRHVTSARASANTASRRSGAHSRISATASAQAVRTVRSSVSSRCGVVGSRRADLVGCHVEAVGAVIDGPAAIGAARASMPGPCTHA